MKRSLIMLSAGAFLFGFTYPLVAQVVELPEIEIVAVNYKYLNAMGEEAAVPVKQLEEAVADYDVKNSEIYQDEYDTYFVSFFIPEGKVLASYDGDGKLLRTAERFENVKLPMAVRKAVTERFPQWNVTKDIYRVTYHDKTGEAKKQYKLVLENGDKRMRVKVDETGEFI